MTDLSALIDKLSPQGRTALARQLAEAGVTVPAGTGPDEPVALIGIGCRYPGGVTSPDEFWRLLTEGRDAVAAFPAERWAGPVNGLVPHYPPDAPESRNPIRSGGFLDDADGFDAAFFGISASEAVGMDPQQRVLLEVAWEALEHAGQPPRALAGSRTGVYVGIGAPDYLVERLHDPATRDDLHTITGAIPSTAVGRLSYLLDLRGPSIAIDTACSSSLVAVHLACQSLRNGESDLALAGGVHVISSVLTSFGLSSAGLADEGGRCKTFDASAGGIVRAEGCGIVALKRLGDAERDGDRILAVLRGSAVNQDGRSTSLTAPSVAAQRDMLTEALRRSGVAPDDVGLIETHGTGTLLGDPIEVEALTALYGRGEPGTCALGAVKTNVGHAEAAAGVTGLIKAVLSVGAGLVPPNVHFSKLNPDITLEGTRFVVPTRTMDWPMGGAARHAAVSAFGIGGTNAHLVLSGPPRPEPRPKTPHPELLAAPLSAGSPAALRSTVQRMIKWLEGSGSGADLADIAYTLGRRSHLEERMVCVLDADAPPSELAARLRDHAAGHQVPGLTTGRPSWATREDGHQPFTEAPAHPVSELQIGEAAAGEGASGTAVVPPLPGEEPGHLAFLTHLSALHCRGVTVQLPIPERGRLLDVPTTAWDHRRYWLRPDGAEPPADGRLHTPDRQEWAPPTPGTADAVNPHADDGPGPHAERTDAGRTAVNDEAARHGRRHVGRPSHRTMPERGDALPPARDITHPHTQEKR